MSMSRQTIIAWAGGTGQMAQAAVEGQTDKQMAMLGAPSPSNPRLQHLKLLYSQKHCGKDAPAAADGPAVRAEDEAMTCEQIAAELAPYAQQMMPNIQALGSTDQQLYAQGRQMQQRRRAENAALTPLADAGAVDPTGASKAAYAAALMVQMTKEKAENDAFDNSPLAQENRAQSAQLAAQAQQMQANGRVQRLMQLRQEKGCYKRGARPPIATRGEGGGTPAGPGGILRGISEWVAVGRSSCCL